MEFFLKVYKIFNVHCDDFASKLLPGKRHISHGIYAYGNFKGKLNRDVFCTGLTWVFGFLTVDDTRVVFHYVFVILNASQGLFIFILFTMREKKVPGDFNVNTTYT